MFVFQAISNAWASSDPKFVCKLNLKFRTIQQRKEACTAMMFAPVLDVSELYNSLKDSWQMAKNPNRRDLIELVQNSCLLECTKKVKPVSWSFNTIGFSSVSWNSSDLNSNNNPWLWLGSVNDIGHRHHSEIDLCTMILCRIVCWVLS